MARPAGDAGAVLRRSPRTPRNPAFRITPLPRCHTGGHVDADIAGDADHDRADKTRRRTT